MTEGASFLALVFIAMPLKYLAGKPLAVSVVGLAHGALFLVFCAALAEAAFRRRLAPPLIALCFGASLVPFGPFLIDKRLRRLDEEPAGH